MAGMPSPPYSVLSGGRAGGMFCRVTMLLCSCFFFQGVFSVVQVPEFMYTVR